MPAGVTGLTQMNFTAGGAITASTQPWTRIVAISADVAGTVKIVDGLGVTRLNLVLGTPGYIRLPGDGIQCQNGATLTLIGVMNCGIFLA